MKEHEFWRGRVSGHVFAIELEDGLVSGSCGPLSPSEIDESFLSGFDYSPERAGWLEAHREEFDLYSWPPMPTASGTARDTLERLKVGDAMHPGVITCLPRASLRDVARVMATTPVHSVVVWGDEEADSEGIWGIVSDHDLIAAAALGEIDARSALGIAHAPVVTVRADQTLRQAAQLMQQHGSSHLVVVGDGVERPVGILSTLDLARAVADTEA